MIDPKVKEVMKMCSSKKAFFSSQIAAKAASKIRRGGGPLMRWYQCPHCSKWHFTSKSDENNILYNKQRRDAKRGKG